MGTNYLSSADYVVENHPEREQFDTFVGRHVLIDIRDAASDLLDDEKYLVNSVINAIKQGGATILAIKSHAFHPCGVTIIVLLSESHLSLHTYPEKNSAFLDVFTCGDCDSERIAQSIQDSLRSSNADQSIIERGDNELNGIEKPNVCQQLTESVGAGLTRSWHVDRVFCNIKTPYQDVLIGKTQQGVSLFCNGERQSTELTQEIYHEGQFIPAALLSQKVESVLIIGSSEGVVSKLAASLGAQKIVHIDIDNACVEACAEYLPYGYTLSDVKKAKKGKNGLKLIIEDGYSYVDKCLRDNKKFDIIVMDLPDETQELTDDAQQNRLYGIEFIEKLSRSLTEQGVFITQAGCTNYWRNKALLRSIRRITEGFQSAVFFEMEEQNWSWVMGINFDCADPVKRMQTNLPKLINKPCYIDELSIRRATILPISIRKKLTKQ